MARKSKSHRTYSFDTDLLDRWENLAKYEDKRYSQKIEEYMAKDLEIFEKNQKKIDSKIANDNSDQSAKLKSANVNANVNANANANVNVNTEDESQAYQIVKRVTELQLRPIIDRHQNDFADPEKSEVGQIITLLENILDKLKIKFKSLRTLKFKEISRFDPLEITRAEGIKRMKEKHEQEERLQVLDQLPNADNESDMQRQLEEEKEAIQEETQLLILERKEEERHLSIPINFNDDGNGRNNNNNNNHRALTVYNEEDGINDESTEGLKDEAKETETASPPAEEQEIIEED